MTCVGESRYLLVSSLFPAKSKHFGQGINHVIYATVGTSLNTSSLSRGGIPFLSQPLRL